jgi:hypothetical protein
VNTLSRIFLSASATLLFVLVALRIGAPERVVNQTAGFVLSMGWAYLLFLGLAEWKGLRIGNASAGKPITLISAFLVAGATDFGLGLGFLAKSESDPILVLFFVTIAVIMLYAWWKILLKGERK